MKVEKAMQHPQHMKISELSFHTGTPVPTIRYYLREGLLPIPIRTGRNMAYYSAEHISSLLRIREMKEGGLPLKEIKALVGNGAEGSASPDEGTAVYSSRRAKIVLAATELFRAKGYDDASVAEIVEHAGIGKGTFYQYFTNKEELFFECADRIFEDIDREVKVLKDITDPIERLWNRAHFFSRSYRHMIDMLNLARGASVKDDPRFRNAYEKVMQNLIGPLQVDVDKAIAAGRIRLKDSALIAHVLMGAVEYCFYYRQRFEVDVDAVVMKAWDIVFGGIASASEREMGGNKR
jgi:AcrR family transcriptional regulator/predicted DNA-binding transcriptional regulator AlpA